MLARGYRYAWGAARGRPGAFYLVAAALGGVQLLGCAVTDFEPAPKAKRP